MINLNKEQHQIIQSNGDIFVKAGAGTGKTRTIVELYFSLLNEKNYDVKNILAITFTDKAAKEMKERIMKRIEDVLHSEGSTDNQYFKGLRSKLNYSWISTMHGFCARLLREFPLEAGIDPLFEVIDEGEKRKRVRYCIRNYFNEQDGSKRFEKLRDLAIIYRYDKLLSIFEEAVMKKQYDLLNYSNKFDVQTADAKTGERIAQSLPVFHEAFNEIVDMYNSENKKENRYDYDQLLFETKRILLNNEGLRKKLQNRFKCIIVDEFQDTNEQQKEIVNHLRGSNKIVFVGDAKQSIYLFNGADVSVFNKTQEEFKDQEKFELFKNYRSNKRLIEFFNLFFSKVFKKDEHKLFTVAYDHLNGENDLILEQPVKLLPIASGFSEECDQISKYILMQLKNGRKFSDFVILLRRMTNVDKLEDAFRKYQIPYYITGSRGFFRTSEILTLKAFVKAVYNPHDEENLIILLRSYVSPFSDSELVEMRKYDKKSLFNALALYSESKLEKKYFFESLMKFRKSINLISPARMIKEIINEFKYEFLLSQLDNAKKRLLNLKKFIEFAESFEGNVSLRNFIIRLDNAQSASESEASADTEKNDVVRVMTIHKSKGLEFPVVIVPELGYVKSSFATPYIVTEYESGRMSLRDPEETKDSGSEYMKMLLYDKEKEFEEEKRVLYVAFTRAEEELILSYSEPKINKKHAVYRKSLIEGKVLKEDGKEVYWDFDEENPLTQFVSSVSNHALNQSKGEESDTFSSRNFPIDEKEILIPKTVFHLENKPWKKYLSPTILSENDFHSVERRVKEIVNEYDGDELKDYSDDSDSEARKKLGIAVHKVLEELGVLKMREFDDRVVTQLLKDDANSRDLIPSVKVIFRKLKESRNKYLNELENAEEVMSEIPVRKKFKQYILTGTIDKLYRYNGVWKVMDFKFAGYSKKNWRKYNFQIQFYLYCLKKLCQPSPEKGYIFFLKNNHVIEVDADPGFELNLEEKIKDFNRKEKI
jgi:ATP-dependent exoDNAse (exonuclease V) beta subunit